MPIDDLTAQDNAHVAECGACDQVAPLQSSGYCEKCDIDLAASAEYRAGANDASDEIDQPAHPTAMYLQGYMSVIEDRERRLTDEDDQEF